MFDDQIKAPASPPPNLPLEPEDMFAGVDKEAAFPPGSPEELPEAAMHLPDALSAGLLKRKAPLAPGPVVPPLPPDMPLPPPHHPQPVAYATKGPILGKIFLFVGGGLVLFGGIVGGWWVYSKYSSPAPAPAAPASTAVQPPTPTTPEPDVTTGPPVAADPTPAGAVEPSDIKTDRILFGESIDSDGDNLDDAREQELGTDPNNKDTDNDGLSDGDEVIIWKTDPRNADSDGDTHVDGKEVRNGYNPLGPGKLFNLPPGVTSTSP